MIFNAIKRIFPFFIAILVLGIMAAILATTACSDGDYESPNDKVARGIIAKHPNAVAIHIIRSSPNRDRGDYALFEFNNKYCAVTIVNDEVIGKATCKSTRFKEQ